MKTEELWDLDAQSSVMGLRREYVNIGGGLAAGSLLSQIVYWWRPRNGKSKLRVKRDGESWIAKSMEEWKSECCLSTWEYKTSVAALKRIGLIEVRVMKFAGRPVTHIRLVAEVLWTALKQLGARIQRAIPISRNPASPNVGILPSLGQCRSESCHSYTETTDTKTTNKESASREGADLRPLFVHNELENSEEQRKSKKEKTNKPWLFHLWGKGGKLAAQPRTEKQTENQGKTAGEILAERQAAKQFPGAGAIAKPLPIFWQCLLAEVKGGFQKPLGVKQCAQLKRFGRDVGEQAWDVLDHAVRNWWSFAHKAKASAGLETCPSDPDTGFLLKHEAVAVNLYLQSIASSCVEPKQKTMLPVPAVAMEEREEDKPYQATMADLEAALASFQKS